MTLIVALSASTSLLDHLVNPAARALAVGVVVALALAAFRRDDHFPAPPHLDRRPLFRAGHAAAAVDPPAPAGSRSSAPSDSIGSRARTGFPISTGRNKVSRVHRATCRHRTHEARFCESVRNFQWRNAYSSACRNFANSSGSLLDELDRDRLRALSRPRSDSAAPLLHRTHLRPQAKAGIASHSRPAPHRQTRGPCAHRRTCRYSRNFRIRTHFRPAHHGRAPLHYSSTRRPGANGMTPSSTPSSPTKSRT